MHFVQLSFISGMMLGIEFPSSKDDSVLFVLDLFIIRVIVFK